MTYFAALSFEHCVLLAFQVLPPTTGVPVVVTGHDTVVSTVSAMCDVFPLYYIIKYRLSSSTGDYTTVNISGTTSVTLVGLVPNAEYDVEVTAINSNGAISNSLLVAHFTVAPTTTAPPSGIIMLLCIAYL